VRALRVLVALLAVAALPAAAYAVDSAAPAPVDPDPTAFRPGAANLSVAAEVWGQSGHRVAAVVSSLRLITAVDEPASTVLVVVAPAGAPTTTEAGALDRFLAEGGSVLLLDPRGGFNPWLVDHGAGVLDVPLLDPTATSRGYVSLDGQADPVVTVVSEEPRKLSLEPDAPWAELLVAPGHVHLDLNRNGTVERVEQAGPHTVGALLETPDGGRVAVIADASAFSDALMQGDANQAFARQVMEQLLPGGGLVIFDETRHGWTQNEPSAAVLVSASQRLAAIGPPLLVAAALAAVAVAVLPAASVPRGVPFAPHEGRVPVDPPPPVEPETANGNGPGGPAHHPTDPDQGGTQT
jgi:hypothetical protein